MKLPGYSAANPYSVCFSNIWFRDTLALTASAPGAKSPDFPFLWWNTFDQFSEHLWFFLELFFHRVSPDATTEAKKCPQAAFWVSL